MSCLSLSRHIKILNNTFSSIRFFIKYIFIKNLMLNSQFHNFFLFFLFAILLVVVLHCPSFNAYFYYFGPPHYFVFLLFIIVFFSALCVRHIIVDTLVTFLLEKIFDNKTLGYIMIMKTLTKSKTCAVKIFISIFYRFILFFLKIIPFFFKQQNLLSFELNIF